MRRLWAVARHTFTEALRTRVVLLFVVLLALCVVGTGLATEGDGTLKGRIQTFLAYATGATEGLLGLVTVFLATGMVANDIRLKSIFIVAAKPLARWQYVLGRWLGLVGINVLLLVLSTATIYALAQYLRSAPTFIERQKAAGLEPAGAEDADRLAVDTQLFASRVTQSMDRPDVEKALQQRLSRLREERGLEPLLRERIRAYISREVNGGDTSVPVDEQMVERLFRDPNMRQRMADELEKQMREQLAADQLQVAPGKSLQINFTGLCGGHQPQEAVQLQYRLTPLRPPLSNTLRTDLEPENPETGATEMIARTDSSESASAVTIAPALIAKDGGLRVTYLNATNLQEGEATSISLRPADVVILYRAGSFGGNLMRGACLILLQQAFLAGVGVLFGLFLSFPVACLSTLIVFVLGLSSSFVLEASRLPLGQDPTLGDQAIYHFCRGMYTFVLPRLGNTSPADSLVDGRHIPVELVAGEFGLRLGSPPGEPGPAPPAEYWSLWRALGFRLELGTGLKTLGALALAWLIFRRRELARVQV